MDVPPLSSAASSAASTRSSAYTTGASALPYADPVHVADPDDDPHRLTDSIAKMLASDPAQSASARPAVARTRWSEYSASIRSRSSSLGNGLSAPPPPLPTHDYPASPPLSQKPSYDVTWDSKDTLSEDDTDDDPSLDDDPIDDDDDERTSAAVLADEGTGLIVHGDNVPVSQLHIPPGNASPLPVNFQNSNSF